MIYKFFDRKTESGVSVNKLLYISNYTYQWLKNSKEGKCMRDLKVTLATNLAENGIISSKNGAVKYLLCVIGVSTKYVWVKPLEDNKS